MDKFDPKIADDNPPMDSACTAGMKLSQTLAPAQPQDFEWEPQRSGMAAHVPDFVNMGVGLVNPFEQQVD
jgi:hypothetical protein